MIGYIRINLMFIHTQIKKRMDETVLLLLQKLINVKTNRIIKVSYWVPYNHLKLWKVGGSRASLVLSRRPRFCDERSPEAFLCACQRWFPSKQLSSLPLHKEEILVSTSEPTDLYHRVSVQC